MAQNSGTELDSNSRAAIKKALVLVKGKEDKLAEAVKACEQRNYRAIEIAGAHQLYIHKLGSHLVRVLRTRYLVR